MLAYVLAWVVGLGSLGLYLAAFFFPEVHRKNDFIWSGVGFFYALVLWVYAERITGAILLGQTAGVALISWLGWETLNLRRQVTPLEQQTELPADLVKTNLQEKLTKQPEKIAGLLTKVTSQIQNRLGSAIPKQGKADTRAAQPSRSSIATRTKQILEKDKSEVAPPQAADTVAPDRTSAETAPVTVKPEVEVTPQSSPDKVVAPDPTAAEVASTAKGGEPKTVETKVTPKGTQAKAAPTKDNLQVKLANLQEKLADLPIRQTWDKLSEQSTSLFTNAKDQVQQILSRVTQRQSKPSVETTQQPTTPSTPADSVTAQDIDFDEDEGEKTAPTATVVDEVASEPVPSVTETESKPKEIAAPVGEEISSETTFESQPEATPTEVVSEAVIEEPVEETSTPDQDTDEAIATESKPATISGPRPLGAEVEAPDLSQAAPEAELAPPAEPLGQLTEPEPSIETEAVTQATPAEPEALGSSTDLDSSEDETHPKLVRPNKPDPSLVEAARRAAEAKHKDASTELPEDKR